MRCAILLGVVVVALAVSTAPKLHAASPSEQARIQELIVAEARDLGVDPALALAVAHAESLFDPDALSPKGARGVMQIMPMVARGEYGLHPDILWTPRINVRMGLHFLRRLLDRYDRIEALALSYYNGGSAVGDLPNARVLPATRGYVAKVLRLKERYQERLAAELAMGGGRDRARVPRAPPRRVAT